jgi:hypothetical protein
MKTILRALLALIVQGEEVGPVRAQAGVASWKAPHISDAFASRTTESFPQSTTGREPLMSVS